MILKQLRKEKNLTQQQVADYVGVTQAAYSGWENEKYEIDKQSLLKLSELFKVSTDYLLGLSNERHRTIKLIDIDNVVEDYEDEIFNAETKIRMRASNYNVAMSELEELLKKKGFEYTITSEVEEKAAQEGQPLSTNAQRMLDVFNNVPVEHQDKIIGLAQALAKEQKQ